MDIINWFKNAYETVKVWFKTKGLKNAGWLVAFVAICVVNGGIPSVSILVAAGFTFLGIFIEKNRKSLVTIFKDLKEQAKAKLES